MSMLQEREKVDHSGSPHSSKGSLFKKGHYQTLGALFQIVLL